MSYIVPSVQVYQQLETSGGVANSTPDLEACIVGPAYNVLKYVSGSTSSIIKTAAASAAHATGSIVANTNLLTFSVIPPFTVGDSLLIPGADSVGGILAATVTAANGVVLTLDTVAGTTATSVVVKKQGILVNPLISNVFNLPNQQVGQIIDTSSINVYANQALIQTLETGFTGYAGSNALVYSAASGTASVTASSATITSVTNATKYREGDTITLSGAGAAGATLTAKILVISGTTFTLDTVAALTVGSSTMTKAAISNISPTTSTLMVEAGDQVVIEYVDTSSVAQTLSTSAITVVSATGTLTNIAIADVLPTTVAPSTTSTALISSGAVGLTLTSATGFATGDTILIKGAGAGGGDHEAVIGTLTGAVITGLSPATITSTTGPVTVLKRATVTFKTRKLFNNQIVPATKPLSGGANYVTTNTAVDGTITINASPEIIYGKLISGTIHIAYKALRTDLSGSILALNDETDILGVFGDISSDNPLALGVSIAQANTTTRVRAIAIPSNDSIGYATALELAQAERVYALVPLTQDQSICQSFNLHCQQMSTPQEALWRIALVNTLIPTTVPVGSYTSSIVNANSGNNTITLSLGNYILTSSNSTFVSDNVVAGDTLHITAGSGSPSPIGTMQVLGVVSNQQLIVAASGLATAVSFYITRTLSKTQRAAAVAAVSTTFGSNRLVHVQPDTIVVNIRGTNVVQPGYYLACALAGLVAGFPSQQGFTNIGIAGVTDLSNSNFTFTRAQLNTMAEAGTCLFIQETSGSIPYVRHELTTDMSVYEYRELQAVKNWDFLSYYFHDKLKPFIGKWNITPDTIGIVKQTVVSSAELVKAKKLPRIGAPLVDYRIVSLAQNAANKDQLDIRLKIVMPSVLNDTNMYLII